MVDKWRHGLDISSAASGKTCINPVAMTTPPANTVPRKKSVSAMHHGLMELLVHQAIGRLISVQHDLQMVLQYSVLSLCKQEVLHAFIATRFLYL